jgi:hypothetical protein
LVLAAKAKWLICPIHSKPPVLKSVGGFTIIPLVFCASAVCDGF